MPSRRSLLLAGAGLALAGCATSTQPNGPAPSPTTGGATGGSGPASPGSATAPRTPATTRTTSASPATTAATPEPTTASPTPSATSTADELYGLAPLLAQRFRAAQAGAQAAGLTLTLTSGYRDPVFQQQLFDEKVKEVGSAAEAEKWVLPPSKSEHCKGMALDVGPTITEMTWLETHSADYGLCRRYENEPWHFELRYPDGSCPPMKANAAEA